MSAILDLAAGRTLDALIDRRLFGRKTIWSPCAGTHTPWPSLPYRKAEFDFGMPVSVPKYSTEIADAWAIVERMRADGFSFKAWQPSKEPYEEGGKPLEHAIVSFICSAGPCPRHGNPRENHHGSYNVEAETLPLAISRAALEAFRATEGGVCAPCAGMRHDGCYEGTCACCGRTLDLSG